MYIWQRQAAYMCVENTGGVRWWRTMEVGGREEGMAMRQVAGIQNRRGKPRRCGGSGNKQVEQQNPGEHGE